MSDLPPVIVVAADPHRTTITMSRRAAFKLRMVLEREVASIDGERLWSGDKVAKEPDRALYVEVIEALRTVVQG